MTTKETTHVHYCLLSTPNENKTYYIRITLGQEQCTRKLPCSDISRAREIYELIKGGRVTPCTLGDILEDMK